MPKKKKRIDINLIKKIAGISSDLGAALHFVFQRIEIEKKCLFFETACPCCDEIIEIIIDLDIKALIVHFQSDQAMENYDPDKFSNLHAIAAKYDLKLLAGKPS